MHETSKSILRRLSDSRFATRYFVGDGIDIGSGPDPLGQYEEQFPLMRTCRSWDMPDGDAEVMASIDDQTVDFVHSSHCLEHMRDPRTALGNWLRILKPGGHLVGIVPDEDMYEQGKFPSTFNPDHKWTFSTGKAKSWSPVSVNLSALLNEFVAFAEILKIERLDASFRFNLPRLDQTGTPVGECGIEFILRRLPDIERQRFGRFPTAEKS
ncbi:MAG: class I SAM-dependent methyltransferase [Alphaproteobacteria bacterium]|nr:class I SAM-dependent methyltransferase [Alphaproteobacteria bacterium]